MIKIELEELDKYQIGKEDIDFYKKYIKEIRDAMERPEFLGEFTEDELEHFLDNNSYIYFYRYHDNIVSTSMLIPAEERDIRDFGLDIDYQKVIDYGPEVVSKPYRGNGLQGYMIEDIEKIAKSLGYEYAITSVHPDNEPSSNNLINHGFELVGFKEFERGPRNIYLKEF